MYRGESALILSAMKYLKFSIFLINTGEYLYETHDGSRPLKFNVIDVPQTGQNPVSSGIFLPQRRQSISTLRQDGLMVSIF